MKSFIHNTKFKVLLLAVLIIYFGPKVQQEPRAKLNLNIGKEVIKVARAEVRFVNKK